MIGLFLMCVAQTSDAAPETLVDGPQPALTATTAMPLPAGGPVSLADLLAAAERQNLDGRITAEQLARAESELRVAWTALLPSLTVSAGWTHNQYAAEIPALTFGPRQVDSVTITPQDQLDLVARVDLPLIDTARWMRTASGEAARDGAAARQKATLDQVRRAVTSSWFTYAGSLAFKVSAERSVAVAQAQLKLQEVRERAGAATELELLRARAELARNQQSVADFVRVIALTRRSLTSLTGLDPGEGARLPAIDLRAPPDLDALEAHLDELPAVRAAVQDLTAAEKVATAGKLALVPTVNASFTERVSNAGGFSGQNAAFALGVNLNWRLDVPTFYNMDAQGSGVAVARLALEKARMAARDQINADLQGLLAALAKVTAAGAQVEAATRAREVATSRYQLGASTQLDVIQADRDLFAAEVQQIQARADLAAARVGLQLSAGLALELP